LLMNVSTFIFSNYVEYNKELRDKLHKYAREGDDKAVFYELKRYANDEYEKLPLECRNTLIGKLAKNSVDEVDLKFLTKKILEVYFDE